MVHFYTCWYNLHQTRCVNCTRFIHGYLRNMNAIDDIGRSVGVERKPNVFLPATYDHGDTWGPEPDEDYAKRVLLALYKSHQHTHGLVWTSDREENHREQWAAKGEFRAYVFRNGHAWSYQVYHAQSGLVVVRGVTQNAELAQQVCSLVLSDQPG